jgi:ABC-type nitrate/sulfonate/bicarbonate transport system ATPase subunit
MSASLGVRRLRIVRESAVSRFELEIGRLDLEAGQVLAVLGANGAGKSTLLRALAGLEPLEAGEVIRHASGPVTMVFQRPIALAGSVVHNVRIALRSQGLNAEEISRRSDEALARFGITDLAPRPATALSGHSPSSPRFCFWTNPSTIWTPGPRSPSLEIFAEPWRRPGSPWPW